MSLLNPLAREISAKIVYYGPGLSGKTTTLRYIHEAVKPERRGELLTLATEGDRTIFFDFLPLHIERVHGLGVRFQLYTVPGQVFYAATRKLVLNGTDGVVFVADSQAAAREANLHSLEDLRANLSEMGIDESRFPIVFQFNKRDLPSLMTVSEMRRELNELGAPEFETAATSGDGVLPALREISRRVIRSLWDEAPRPPTLVPPPSPAANAVAESSMVGSIVDGLRRAAEHPEMAIMTPVPPPIVEPLESDAGVSFCALWEGRDNVGIAAVEAAIRERLFKRALELSAAALAELLASLPADVGADSPVSRALLLGLDGREYLRLARLVSLPEHAVTEQDALFGLYVLVAARVKSLAVV